MDYTAGGDLCFISSCFDLSYASCVSRCTALSDADRVSPDTSPFSELMVHGPSSLIPNFSTIARAVRVACSRSEEAPDVMDLEPKTTCKSSNAKKARVTALALHLLGDSAAHAHVQSRKHLLKRHVHLVFVRQLCDHAQRGASRHDGRFVHGSSTLGENCHESMPALSATG